MKIEVDGNSLDFDEEDESEFTVSRDWCRSGIPSWLKAWTQATYPWDDGAITRFDTLSSDALKSSFRRAASCTTAATIRAIPTLRVASDESVVMLRLGTVATGPIVRCNSSTTKAGG